MKWLKYVMLLAAVSLAAITKITLPTDFNTVANGTRANLSSNFSEIDTRSDAAFDSVDEVRGRMTGYTGDFTITSLDHLRLRLDSDGSILGRFFISNGSTGDSLWRISEDSTWRAFGAGTGTKLTLSDSILAATARISGSGTFGGTLGVTGASTIAALSATTGTFSSTLGVTGASTLAALSATTGSFSSTLGVTGTTTLGSTVIIGAGIQMENQQAINMKNTSGTLRSVLNVNASNNLAIGGTVDGGINFYTNLGNNAGVVSSAGAWALPSTLGVTGNLTLSTLSSGRIPVVSTAGLITQDNLYWDATNDRLGIGSGASSPSYESHISKSSAGSSVGIGVFNTDNTNTASNARIVLEAGGTSAGDAYIQYGLNGSTNWTGGLDNSDGDAFVLSESSTLGSSNRLRIASGGAVTIPGTLGVTGAVSTGALTATTATLGGGESFVYGDTSFTLTGSTGWTTTPTGTAYATRIGKVVTLTIPYFTGTSNSTSTTLTGVPSGWYPSTLPQDINIPVVVDNGSFIFSESYVSILTSGSIGVQPNSTLAWTASGTKRIGTSGTALTVTYLLQ